MVAETGEIWREFSGALRGFILSRVHDDDAADDILQDAFIKIHKNIDNLKDERKLRAWLYQITRNTIMDYYRKREATVELPDMPDLAAAEVDADSEVGRDIGPCVRALVDRLPDRYKEPLVMTDLDGLTQKEMGERLDLSVSGAKSRVQRARGKLKDLLLDCCQFEFDRRGNIMDYEPKSSDSPECCGGPTGSCSGEPTGD